MTKKETRAGIPAASPEVPFESALERLETIVQSLERGDLALAESLKLFEEGVTLARRLEGELGEAEMKVEKLLRDAQGRESTVPLDASEAEERG